jgi:hypothetical protein
MASQKVSSDYFASRDWTHTSRENGTFSCEQIAAGAATDAAGSLREIANTLGAILSRLDQLGADGIHTLIQEHARAAARTRAKRHQRAKKARAKLRAARKAA